MRPLYLEMDASKTGLEAGLLQEGDGMNHTHEDTQDNAILRQRTFTSKMLFTAERGYSNIKREAFRELYGLHRFHHCCLPWEVSIITDYTPFIAIFKKDVATLALRLQCIHLRIHQNRFHNTP